MEPTEILDVWRQKGAMEYAGEGVSQLQHAWQCAQLAHNAGASDALQLASWLHDLGHLLTDLQGSPTLAGVDDRHEALGAGVLAQICGAPVSEPVRLHVQAKRYMVATLPNYQSKLSQDSVRSLALQGGPMDVQECNAFSNTPYADDAVRLRAWDDLAKQHGVPDLPDAQILQSLEALMQCVPRRLNPAVQ